MSCYALTSMRDQALVDEPPRKRLVRELDDPPADTRLTPEPRAQAIQRLKTADIANEARGRATHVAHPLRDIAGGSNARPGNPAPQPPDES
jgi:hypothetical protein